MQSFIENLGFSLWKQELQIVIQILLHKIVKLEFPL